MRRFLAILGKTTRMAHAHWTLSIRRRRNGFPERWSGPETRLVSLQNMVDEVTLTPYPSGFHTGVAKALVVQPLILLFRPYQKFQRPQSLKVSGVKAKLAQALVEDKDVNHVVGFQSGRLVFTLGWLSPYHYPGGLSSFFPRAYWNALDVLGKLQQNDWSLRRNFINSIYPACTFNMGL